MGMEIIYKTNSLLLYVPISFAALQDRTTDSDTEHMRRGIKETYIMSAPWNT